jgi:hypothetical protein
LVNSVAIALLVREWSRTASANPQLA